MLSNANRKDKILLAKQQISQDLLPVKILAVLSGKGGVGKTSVSAMLAMALAEKYRTLIIDFDLCGPSVYRALGAKGKMIKDRDGFKPLNVSPGLDILSFGATLGQNDAVIWRGAKKKIFLDLFLSSAKDYDILLIDTPPGISDEHLFLAHRDINALIVTTPQNVALNDTQRCIEFCQGNAINIVGVLENMSFFECECCAEKTYIFGGQGGKSLAEEYQLNFLGEIPLSSELSECIDSDASKMRLKSLEGYKMIQSLIADGRLCLQ
ncbi:hypothetical protein ENBRE01_0050 [Enteropsectra breve]|nr:hypothetical protein ENBRE01_0050 [Enteropsectra breve]